MELGVRVLVTGIVCVWALGAAACGPAPVSSGAGDDDDGDSGPGPDPTPVASCAAACTTDLGAARTALTAGNYQGAFDLYKCADTPEAAFGAGLTRALLAFEGNNAKALLATFGEPPLPATDVFGADGVLGRSAARWNGDGSLALTGALEVSIPFDRAMHEVSDDVLYSAGTVRAEDRTSAAHASFSLSLNTDSTAGPIANGTVLAVTNQCNTTFSSTNLDPRLGWLDLEVEVAGTSYYCEFPYSLEASQCQPDGGSIIVTQAATLPGQPAAYQFADLLLQCSSSGDDGSLPPVFPRVSGTLSATAVSARLDTTGLHPMFGADHSLRVPVGTVLTDALRRGGSAAAELEEAACFFKLAGQGSGNVYTVPGVLFGGSDVPFSKGDAEIVAAAALFGAAAGHFAWVHDIDMPLGDLICDSDDCPTDAEFVTRFNDTFASGFHPDRLLVVERLATESLELLERGIADLDATSLLVRNGVSAAGLDAARALVQAALSSVQGGQVTLSRFTPPIDVNFKAYFEEPRNPKQSGAILVYEEECEAGSDPPECYSDTYIDPAFLERYFEGRIDADFDGSYEWADGNAFGDAMEEVGNNMSRHAISLD